MSDLIGQILLHQFRVDAFVASGGMGAVYRVWDLQRNVPLAMKVLHADLADDPAVLDKFKREARALEKLAHPNIVPFYGLHQTNDFAFLLERFIDGPSLKDILNERKTLSIEETLSFLKALCAALGYAHSQGFIHCDIKPGNILIDPGGNIYLTDFGVVRHTDSTVTAFGAAGTPSYMSPEQILSQAVTPATDMYALGVMLFEMLTGQRPFRGTETGTEKFGDTKNERIRYEHLHLPPPNPRSVNPNIPESLAQVILRALNKDPQRRFATTQELFLTAISAVSVDQSQVSERLPFPQPQVIPQKTSSLKPAWESTPAQPYSLSIDAGVTKKRSDFRLYFLGVIGAVIVVILFLFVRPFSMPGESLTSQTKNANASFASTFQTVLPTSISTEEVVVTLTNNSIPIQLTEVIPSNMNIPTLVPSFIQTPRPTFTATQMIPTRPFDFNEPDISQWPVMLSDTFDNNENEWFVGETDVTYIEGENLITNGKYWWGWTAVQSIHYSVTPNMDDVSDFNLTVAARQVEGNPGTYGLIFREAIDGRFYYFLVNDATQEFAVLLSNGDSGWTTLMGNTYSSNIRPGDVNQLMVTALGSIFHFYINNQYMGELIDDSISMGIVGLAAELFTAGDEAIYEFDNFVLRTPAQTSTPTLAPSSASSPSPSSPRLPTNPPKPTEEPTRKPASKRTKTPAPPGGATNTPASP